MDLTTRLLIPIIVLQNHNRYNIFQAGHNTSIDIKEIEREVGNPSFNNSVGNLKTFSFVFTVIFCLRLML